MQERFIAVAVFAALAAPLAHAFEVRKDSTGALVKWASGVPFHFEAGFDAKLGVPGATEALKKSVAAYNEGAPVQVSIDGAATRGMGFDPKGANENDIVVLEQWPYNPNSLAVTVVTIEEVSHTIVDADIAINHSDNTFAVLAADSVRGGDNYDLQNTVMHELGHAVGLAHSSQSDRAVMFPLAYPGEVNKRTLSDDDIDGLRLLYATASSTLTEAGDAAVGCSQAGHLSVWAALGAAATLLRRRRVNAHALFAGLVAAVAFRAAPSMASVDEGSSARVVSVETVRSSGLFESRVILADADGTLSAMTWPGGRVGNFTQVVDDSPVPSVGTSLTFQRSLKGSTGHSRWFGAMNRR